MVDPGKNIIIFSDELILKGSLLFLEKSYPLGVIAIFGNFFFYIKNFFLKRRVCFEPEIYFFI